MRDRRFDALRDRLILEGATPRYARRLTGELSQHWSDLTDAAVAAGATVSEAEYRAHRQLGSDDDIARQVQATGRFRAFGRRHPVICFLAAPLLTVVCVSATGVALLSAGLGACRTYLGVQSVEWVAAAVSPFLLAMVPLLCAALAAGWCIYACRRRCAVHWPLLACAVLSVTAAFFFIDVVPPRDQARGAIVAGLRSNISAWMLAGVMVLPAALMVARAVRRSAACASDPRS